ncbi:MAG: hypothetical protein JNM84_24220 [Planctomycetes bacterium]|nr:hypothetical protein [Planctomycetota bacterium]
MHPREDPRILAYVRRTSLEPGEVLELCVSAPVGLELRVDWRRVGGGSENELPPLSFASRYHPIPEGAASAGCGWPTAVSLELPAELRSGLYVARISAPVQSAEPSAELSFVVRESSAAGSARILMLRSFCTELATNRFGVPAGYPHAHPVRSAEVPLLVTGDPRLGAIEPFVDWLEGLGLPVAYAEDRDLHRDPELLQRYDLVIVAGASAYWSRKMRAGLDAFLGNGGRLFAATGNLCSSQVRLDEAGQVLFYYHDPRNDPLFVQRSSAAQRALAMPFALPPVDDPEERTLGLAHRFATSATALGRRHPYGPWRGVDPDQPYESGFGYYAIEAPEHPFLAPLEARRGALFGIAETRRDGATFAVITVSGHVDGAPIERREGRLIASRGGEIANDLRVLCIAPATTGFAALADWEDFGRVVHAGARNFAHLPFGAIPEISIAEVQEFAARVVRELALPRRSRAGNGGFELSGAMGPRGFDVRGSARVSPEAALSGRSGCRLDARSALRFALPPSLRRGGACGAFVRTTGLGASFALVSSRDGAVRDRLEITSEDWRAAWLCVPPGLEASEELLCEWIAPRDTSLDIDNFECLEQAQLERASILESSAEGVVGGRSYLAVGRAAAGATGPWDLSLIDLETGRALSEPLRASGHPFAMQIDARLGERAPRAALSLRGRDGEVVAIEQALLLPLGVRDPSPGLGDRARPIELGGSRRSWGWAPMSPANGPRWVLSFWHRGPASRARWLDVGEPSMPRTVASIDLEPSEHHRCVQVEVSLAERRSGPEPPLRFELHLEGPANTSIERLRLLPAQQVVLLDCYANGDFEIAPSPAEVARGADWSKRIPNWARSEDAAVELSAGHAFTGERSLALRGNAASWASSVIPDAVTEELGVRLRARIRAERPSQVRLELRALDPFALETCTLASWTNRASETWESASLAAHPEVVRGRFASGWYQGWIFVELLDPGRVLLDEITVEMDR